VHPIYHVRAFHHGVDLAAPVGTPIYAAGNGEVILATSGGTGYGRFIVIDHGGGVTTLYGHCSAFAVGVGAKVKKGQAIAYVGSTGSSTGPHCHFEVRRNGSTVPPM
jgi:murein DD-endopeptidase MepM/ murein hydrolase activator NlpD